MSDGDRTKWNDKYDKPGYRRGGKPPAFLRGIAAALPKTGRALDLACGEGQALVFLAERGLDGIGVDVSPRGLAKAVELAAERGVTEKLLFAEHDLDDGLPDLDGPFDVIVCVHFHDPSMYAGLREMLAPGGHLVVETLTTENEELGLPSPSLRFLAQPGELLTYAEGLRVRLYREALIDGTVRAQLLAQKPPGTPPDLRR